MNLYRRILIFTGLLLFAGAATGQSETDQGPDSAVVKTGTAQADTARQKEHSPKKAALYSAVLPGMGQAYNKKYWKLPIVYGALGTSIYFIVQNNKYYQEFLTSYKAVIDDDPNTTSLYPQLGEQQLLSNVNTTRTWLEISVMATAGIYILQIVDAAVDAHLYTFDVSDDLSMNIQPTIIRTNSTALTGMALTLKF